MCNYNKGYTKNSKDKNEMSINCDFRMGSNLSNHQLKIDRYKYSLVYIKYMVTIYQKSIRYKK